MIIDTAVHHLRGDEENSRDMRESQRALELRKFFAPNYKLDSRAPAESGFNDTLTSDGALHAYAETVVWRLKGCHAMVSLIDRGTQYFLAGALRTADEEDPDSVVTLGEWFGCSTVPTPGGLCEHTLELDSTKDDYPCFIVNDLTKDERFAHLPVVAGAPYYKFYVGVPITTKHGVNIGSFFLFDNKARNGLPYPLRKFIHQQAENVMKHLETKREAAERRRAALMSKGIARFLERTSHEAETNDVDSYNSDDEALIINPERESVGTQTPAIQEEKSLPEKPSVSVLDKIRAALDDAAEILRVSLELTAGGVVFLDTAVGYIDNEHEPAPLNLNHFLHDEVHGLGVERAAQSNSHSSQLSSTPSNNARNTGRHLSQRSTRSSTDKNRVSKIMAISTAETATWDPSSISLDSKSLDLLIKSYPKGNVWYIDEEGYFSSLEQIHDLHEVAGTSPTSRRQSISPLGLTKQREEAKMLSRVFHDARQIIFLPLWDAGADRWYSGCFVWSKSATPVFTVESEISYLSSFTNSVMVEISRLDAITSNKMKSDFISSISHEFRSPLHGILSCTEFLRDSNLDASQIEFISTIQNCSGTLLDTINHVLDYSKINSFENTGSKQGTISNELYQETNLALLCEDIVNGMIAANEFRGAGSGDVAIPAMNENSRKIPESLDPHSPIEIILDIESREWEYKIQPGALRRVVMNLFGNAQKYTKAGYIMVQLQIQNVAQPNVHEAKTSNEILILRVRDTGKGMSSEYMERKLYHPFAQEDSFATGIGLGLSIVWSIVNQLGGKISIGSEVGKGTDVEVTIPVDKAIGLENMPSRTLNNFRGLTDAEACIPTLRERGMGKSVCLRQINKSCQDKNASWKCIERYCKEWFGFIMQDISADIVITDDDEFNEYSNSQIVLFVHKNMSYSDSRNGWRRNHPFGSISEPVGPFKLARSILALLDQSVLDDERILYTRSADVSTQTPLGSPEERTIMNGIIMTDYGFLPLTTPSDIPITQRSSSFENKTQFLDSVFEAPHLEKGWNEDSFTNIRTFPALPLKLPAVRRNMPLMMSFPKPALEEPLLATEFCVRGLHILAVDDNTLNLQLLLRYLLKRKTDKILTASNGIEAVAAVCNSDDPFDAIFMDISMPGMDGFEATRLIRNYEKNEVSQSEQDMKGAIVGDNKPASIENESTAVISQPRSGVKSNAYIVALTGLGSHRDREKAKDSGFDDFLTKPISFAKIGELLKKLSEEKEIISHV